MTHRLFGTIDVKHTLWLLMSHPYQPSLLHRPSPGQHSRPLPNPLSPLQVETGNPYMLYKDHANRKSNQQNLGTIKCSNLCTEIIEYTSDDETAVCNLASIALPRFVREKDNAGGWDGKGKLVGSLDSASRFFDFERLIEVTQMSTRNLNRIIDENHYPVKTAERSNLRHRPIGLGVQGLADTFILLGLAFDSPEVGRWGSHSSLHCCVLCFVYTIFNMCRFRVYMGGSGCSLSVHSLMMCADASP